MSSINKKQDMGKDQYLTLICLPDSINKEFNNKIKIDKNNILKYDTSFFSGLINTKNNFIYIKEDLLVIKAIAYYFKNDLLINHNYYYSTDFLMLLKNRCNFYCLTSMLNEIKNEINNRKGIKKFNLPIKLNEELIASNNNFIIKINENDKLNLEIIINKSDDLYDLILKCHGKLYYSNHFTVKFINIEIIVNSVNEKLKKNHKNVTFWGGNQKLNLIKIPINNNLQPYIEADLNLTYILKEIII